MFTTLSAAYWAERPRVLSSSFLAYIETKGRKASLETIQKLAQALRIPVARLFETAPGPGKDAVYEAIQQFAQLILDKTAKETSGILARLKAIGPDTALA